jgi:hypothetical protein
MKKKDKFEQELGEVMQGYTQIFDRLRSNEIFMKEASKLLKPLDKRLRELTKQLREMRIAA